MRTIMTYIGFPLAISLAGILLLAIPIAKSWPRPPIHAEDPNTRPSLTTRLVRFFESRVDGSSLETFERSVAKIKEDLHDEDEFDFEKSIAFLFADMHCACGSEEPGSCQAFRSKVDGMAARKVISSGKLARANLTEPVQKGISEIQQSLSILDGRNRERGVRIVRREVLLPFARYQGQSVAKINKWSMASIYDNGMGWREPTVRQNCLRLTVHNATSTSIERIHFRASFQYANWTDVFEFSGGLPPGQTAVTMTTFPDPHSRAPYEITNPRNFRVDVLQVDNADGSWNRERLNSRLAALNEVQGLIDLPIYSIEGGKKTYRLHSQPLDLRQCEPAEIR